MAPHRTGSQPCRCSGPQTPSAPTFHEVQHQPTLSGPSLRSILRRHGYNSTTSNNQSNHGHARSANSGENLNDCSAESTIRVEQLRAGRDSRNQQPQTARPGCRLRVIMNSIRRHLFSNLNSRYRQPPYNSNHDLHAASPRSTGDHTEEDNPEREIETREDVI